MIEDISQLSVQPDSQPLDDTSYFLYFQGRDVLLGTDECELTRYGAVKTYLPSGMEPFELLSIGGKGVFTFLNSPIVPVTAPIGMRFCDIGTLRSMPEAIGSILAACWHLRMWYERNRFCGHCGKPLVPSKTERALCCPACGQIQYPTISPAVIVAITKGEQILLALNVNNHAKRYALIAGYVEVGETLEHAVRREAMEEVGLKLKNLRYLRNQPWGLGSALMLAFCAEAEEGEIVLQESELADARWVSRDELEPREANTSVAFAMIEDFRLGRI